jgi:hypothetical protein
MVGIYRDDPANPSHRHGVSGVLVTFSIEAPAGAGASFNGQLTATAPTTRRGKAAAPLLIADGTSEEFTVLVTVGSLSTLVTITPTNGR